MNDDVTRAILHSLRQHIRTTQQVIADLRASLYGTDLAILRTKGMIQRSDELIRSLSKAFVGDSAG